MKTLIARIRRYFAVQHLDWYMYMHFIEMPPLARHTLYNKIVAILGYADADDDIVWYIETHLNDEFEAACAHFCILDDAARTIYDYVESLN
jgi:hypothetical protein